jgi:hypothetical protein
MRPKKRILLIDAVEPRLSMRRFMLTINHYAVFSAGSAEEALTVAAECDPVVAVLIWPLKGARELLNKLHGDFPLTATIILAEGLKELPEAIYPHAILYGNISANAFLYRLTVLAAGKRGPRKKPVQPVSVDKDRARRIA